MNVGIDITALSNPEGGGIRTFLYYPLKEIAKLDKKNKFFLYSNKNVDLPFLQTPNWSIRCASYLMKFSTLWLQTDFYLLSAKDSLEVFWGPRFFVPLLTRMHTFSTVFDLAPIFYPHLFTLQTRLLVNFLIGKSVKRAEKIIAVSNSSADDLMKQYGVPSKKIVVLYGGVDFEIFMPVENAHRILKERYKITKPFLLCLDVFNPRKNFSSVLYAYKNLPSLITKKYDIVATGSIMKTRAGTNIFNTFDAKTRAKELGIFDNVKFAGYISHTELPIFYSAAEALIYPSLYEGFGLPVLEAMSCGCPVIVSNSSSLPEVGGKACLYVNPKSPQDIKDKILLLLKNKELKSELKKRGIEHSKNFSWEKFAKGVIGIIESF